MTMPLWKQSNVTSAMDILGASGALSVSRLGNLDNVTQALTSQQEAWGAISEIHNMSDASGITGALASMSSVLDSIYGSKSAVLNGLGSLAAHSQMISSVVGSNTALIESAKNLTQSFTLSESMVSGLGRSIASQAAGLKGLANSLDTSPKSSRSDSWASRFGSGMVASEFMASRLLPSELDPSLFADELLESAQVFEDEFGGTEVEESANEFLDSHVDVAVQITNSPYLVTLTFKQRRLVARYLAVVVYISFVSIAIYGFVVFPVFLQVLALFGVSLGHKSAATTTYKYSLKALDRYMADSNGH